MHEILYYPDFEPSVRYLRTILLFFDRVYRIIPPESGHVDTLPVRKLIECIPSAFKVVCPTPKDKEFKDINFDLLEKAFARIRRDAGARVLKTFRFQRDATGRMQLRGLLSNSKVAEYTLILLEKYKLADVRANMRSGWAFGDTFPVNEDAGNLIVSCLADRMARRLGIDTITDRSLPYTLQALEGIGVVSDAFPRAAEGLLAAAVATVTIPAGIEQLPLTDYQEMRQSFADIREPVHRLISELSLFHKIYRQQSAAAAEKAVQEALADYTGSFEKYRKTRYARKIDRWVPFCFQTLLNLISCVAKPEIQIVLQSANVGVEIIKTVHATQQGQRDKTFRMLCKLQQQIDKKSRKKLINDLI